MKKYRVRVVLPSIVTLGNLLCGFLAVANVIEATSESMISAAWWIIIAGVLDALDGKVARMTGSSSDFGIEFDSIADVVSFGLAPAALFYRYILAGAGRTGLALAFLFLAAGAMRLARYNVSAATGSKKYFTGMPIPAGAGILASFVLFNENVWGGTAGFDFASALIFLSSIAMVSRFRYSALPRIGFRSRKSAIKSVLLLGNVILISFFPNQILFPEGVLYLISGPASYLTAPAFMQIFNRANNTSLK